MFLFVELFFDTFLESFSLDISLWLKHCLNTSTYQYTQLNTVSPFQFHLIDFSLQFPIMVLSLDFGLSCTTTAMTFSIMHQLQ